MNLDALAKAVVSNFKQLHEAEIIGRIMLLSGRSFTRSLSGYKILVEKKMLPESFVCEISRGKLSTLLERNPAIGELLDRLDMIPTKWTETDFTFDHPKPLTVQEIAIRLQLQDLDF